MNTTNLFDRLESYAQKNFATEILVFVLQTNAEFQRKFLDLILSGRPRQLRAAFDECEIVTQVSYVSGKPDIRIASRTRSDLKIFVEVKIRAEEGHNQIERYERSGYVALLAPHLLHAHEGKNFLGHFFFF
jgi:hypothetical protein